jgi:hypothetical protein
MPPTDVFQRAGIKPLSDDPNQDSLSLRIILERGMISHKDWPHWQTFFRHAKMPIYNSLQFPCHIVSEISVPMRLSPRQTVR